MLARTWSPFGSFASLVGSRLDLTKIFSAWLGVSILASIFLCFASDSTIRSIAIQDDSPSYIQVAETIVAEGVVPSTPRSLGYPLFLAAARAVAGPPGFLPLVIGLQLLANCLLAAMSWRLFQRIAPGTPNGVCAVFSSVCFLGGLGIATNVMTDLLATTYFLGFVLCWVFSHRRSTLVVAALCLAAATLLRPSFTYLPALLPAVWWLMRRIPGGRRASVLGLVLMVLASVSGTLVSTVHQLRTVGYPGPSHVLSFNLQKTLRYAIHHDGRSQEEFDDAFEHRIESITGLPIARVAPSTREEITKAVFLDAVRRQPTAVGRQVGTTFVKYLACPIEAPVLVAMTWRRGSGGPLPQRVRMVLGGIGLPLWLLALWPPSIRLRGHGAYYWMTMILVVYVVGLSSLAPLQGERMRLPVLPLMLGVVLVHFESARRKGWFAWRPAAQVRLRAELLSGVSRMRSTAGRSR